MAVEEMAKSDNRSLGDRLKFLLSSGEGADVHFLVGQGNRKELFSAHKLILTSASDVFAAMFRYDAANATTSAATAPLGLPGSPVVVSDVDAEVFGALLAFIYSDDTSGVDGENLFNVLYAAKKYNIAGLVNACSEFPLSELDNVFHTLAEARLFEENKFANHCLEYIDQNANTLLQSKEFLQIDQQMLCEILERDQLAIGREFTIWKAALRWADEQCGRKGLECSGENRREMLGPALFEIRFPQITKEDFSKSIVPCEVLTDREVVSVLLYHCLPRSNVNYADASLTLPQFPLRFLAEARDYLCQGTLSLRIKRFSSKFALGKQANCTSKVLRIRDLFWYITAAKKFDAEMGECVKFCLHCCINDPSGVSFGNSAADGFTVSCSAVRRIVSQKEDKKDHVRESRHVFDARTGTNNSSELPNALSIKKLMDSDNGWYDEADDTLKVEVELTANVPHIRETRRRAGGGGGGGQFGNHPNNGFGNGGFHANAHGGWVGVDNWGDNE